MPEQKSEFKIAIILILAGAALGLFVQGNVIVSTWFQLWLIIVELTWKEK
jgi:hypothetical protein